MYDIYSFHRSIRALTKSVSEPSKPESEEIRKYSDLTDQSINEPSNTQYKDIFDTVIGTFKSETKEGTSKDNSDMQDFSSDSDDEETNLLNHKFKDIEVITKEEVSITFLMI